MGSQKGEAMFIALKILQAFSLFCGLLIPAIFFLTRRINVPIYFQRITFVTLLFVSVLGATFLILFRLYYGASFTLVGSLYLLLQIGRFYYRLKIIDYFFLLIGCIEFTIMGYYTVQPGNTWGPGIAPFAAPLLPHALLLVVIAFSKLNLKDHVIGILYILLPLPVWFIPNSYLDSEFWPSQYVVYYEVLSYMIWFFAAIHIVLALKDKLSNRNVFNCKIG